MGPFSKTFLQNLTPLLLTPSTLYYTPQQMSQDSKKLILREFQRNEQGLTGSPFCQKAWMYLKFAEVDFESEYCLPNSGVKGKMPEFVWNGQTFPDSSLGMEELIKLGVVKDLNQGLSSEEKAIGLAFQRLIEQGITWQQAWERWNQNWPKSRDEYFMKSAPYPIRITIGYMLHRNVNNAFYSQGIGRHSPEEVYGMMKKDVAALSDYLGDKTWLLGTKKPTTVDATLCGWVLSCLDGKDYNPRLWQELNSHQNLVSYLERAKGYIEK